MNNIEKVEKVIGIFKDITSEVQNVFEKEWLIPSQVSHIARLKGYPREFIRKIINCLYLAGDI